MPEIRTIERATASCGRLDTATRSGLRVLKRKRRSVRAAMAMPTHLHGEERRQRISQLMREELDLLEKIDLVESLRSRTR